VIVEWIKEFGKTGCGNAVVGTGGEWEDRGTWGAGRMVGGGGGCEDWSGPQNEEKFAKAAEKEKKGEKK